MCCCDSIVKKGVPVVNDARKKRILKADRGFTELKRMATGDVKSPRCEVD